MKLIILVLSKKDDNGIYDRFYNTQKQTWDSINVEHVDTFFYFGDHPKNHIDGHDIFLSVQDTLKNCAIKTVEAFKLIKNFDYDFIFRTNSSSYVDKQLLYNFLIDKPKFNYYSGKVGHHYDIPFASGSGFIMSKDVVNFILDNTNKINYHFLDDVAFGKFLSDNNIHPKELPRFDVVSDLIDRDYFHYRIKNDDREKDIKYMEKIFELKKQ
jgi:hypothetical protein